MDFSQVYFEVIENDLILREILSNVDAYHLKTFRLVNHRWNNLVTSLLLRRQLLHIQIDYFQDLNIFYVDNGQERSQLPFSLQDLSSCINNSSRFPCASYTIKGMPSLKFDESLQGFIHLHGNAIKTLHFMCITSIKDLRFILEKTPSLENLAIIYLNIQDGYFETHISTRLKTIQVQYLKQSPVNHQVFKYLIQSSPYLKKLQHFQIEHLNLVRETGKLHLIQQLEFAPQLGTLEMYRNLASLPIYLTELNISMIFGTADDNDTEFSNQVVIVLSNILHSSASTLKKLKMLPLSGWNVQFPVLPNLKYICFIENDEYLREYSPQRRINSEHVFPVGFDFATTFPSISSICFAGIGDRDVASFFPEVKTKAIKSEELQILTRVTPEELFFLTTKLSLMTKLELRHTFLDTTQVNLWNLLPNTVCNLRLYDSTFFVPFPSKSQLGLLDYYFTRIFHNDLECSTTQSRIFHLKNTEEHAFTDLQNLRSLDFTFELLDSYLNLTWFTPLTGRYAFAAMENLRVTFYYNRNSENAKFLQETLSPMSSFVTFSHNNYRLTNDF